MPFARHFTRRRLCLAFALLAVATVGAVELLCRLGTELASRAKYDQIQVGMSAAEVHQLLDPISERSGLMPGVEMWLTRDAAIIVIGYDRHHDVADKEFHSGDQSFKARARRLLNRVGYW
jgi:hypothetical protein